ncbi:Hypothetical_protein [Hexamita inflata]|uniref:Hypothetical_protein n=1 Tax=Hexamita inflata TaxID=28002 RepID=A0AA86V0E1_9EUKA|nr:Hypothetical protein HINF_LOCUS58997 [Hexamita inflata]
MTPIHLCFLRTCAAPTLQLFSSILLFDTKTNLRNIQRLAYENEDGAGCVDVTRLAHQGGVVGLHGESDVEHAILQLDVVVSKCRQRVNCVVLHVGFYQNVCSFYGIHEDLVDAFAENEVFLEFQAGEICRGVTEGGFEIACEHHAVAGYDFWRLFFSFLSFFCFFFLFLLFYFGKFGWLFYDNFWGRWWNFLLFYNLCFVLQVIVIQVETVIIDLIFKLFYYL